VIGTTREFTGETEEQRKLRHLFDVAAAMSLAVACRLDAEPEMARFLEAVKSHPDERAYIVKLFLDSFSDSFYMRHEPSDLLMYCMSELHWVEIRDYARRQRDEDVKKHGVVCYGIWNDILESFEPGWREKYFQDFTKQPESRQQRDSSP
jgi:hypothetical protein